MPYKDPTDPKSIEAAKAARRKHYLKNKAQYIKNSIDARKARRNKTDELKKVPCMDCKRKFPPYVMDFDHREGTDKVANVSLLVTVSWPKMLEEIKKCDIVCANCHRIRTHDRYGGPRQGAESPKLS